MTPKLFAHLIGRHLLSLVFVATTTSFAQVTKPNGATIWTLGQKNVLIEWGVNTVPNVKIELYIHDYVATTITSSTFNDGSFSWNVPTTLESSHNYRVKVTPLASGYGGNYSDPFSIEPAPPGPPVVTTGGTTNVTGVDANLWGTIDPNGAQTTTFYFDYGTSTSYGSRSGTSSITGTSEQDVESYISGLSQTTTYHYRLVATNAAATTYGTDRTFTTTTLSPSATTNGATSIGQTTATFNASVNPHGKSTDVTFQYGLSGSYGQTSPSQNIGYGSSAKAVSYNVSGLSSGQVYHYRVVASSSGGTTYGGDKTFTSLTALPAAQFTVRSVPTGGVDPMTMFYVTFKLRNSGQGVADHGGISVSFPTVTLPNTDGGATTYNSNEANIGPWWPNTDFATSELHLCPSGTMIDKGGTQSPADYLLYEAAADNWQPGVEKQFALGIFVKNPESFRINVRGWMTTNGYSTVYRDPTSSGVNIIVDQQEYYAYEYSLIINSVQPDLVIGSLTAPSSATVGEPIGVSWSVRNQGTQLAGVFTSGLFLSTDATITAQDIPLASHSHTQLAAGTDEPIGPLSVSIPNGTSPGNYYIGALADVGDIVHESLEENNSKSATISVSAPVSTTLTVTVNNIPAGDPNVPGANGRVALYNSIGVKIDSQSTSSYRVATFANVPVGSGYSYRVYHIPSNPSTPFGQEYWGQRTNLTIGAIGAVETFIRNQPFGNTIRVFQGNTDVTGQTVTSGTQLMVKFLLKNPSSMPQNANGNVRVDRDKQSVIDFDLWGNGFESIPANGTLEQSMMWTPTVAGSYFAAGGVDVSGGGTPVFSDGGPWGGQPIISIVGSGVGPASVNNSNLPLQIDGHLINSGELIVGDGGIRVSIMGPPTSLYVGRTYVFAIRIQPGPAWTSTAGDMIPQKVLGLGSSELLVCTNSLSGSVGTPVVKINGTTVGEEVIGGLLGILSTPISSLFTNHIAGFVVTSAAKAANLAVFSGVAPTQNVNVTTPSDFSGSGALTTVRLEIGDLSFLGVADAKVVELRVPITFTAPGEVNVVFFPDIRGEALLVPADEITSTVPVGFEYRQQITLAASVSAGPPPPIQCGTTIISHGFIPPVVGKDPIEGWMRPMANAIVQRAQGGNVRIYNRATGSFDQVSGSAAAGENVLLFNWVEDSGFNINRMSEAAADALFSALMNAQKRGDIVLNHLHFIGHSRGCVVNSETVERLLASGIEVEQVTNLDPHDWGALNSTIYNDNQDVNYGLDISQPADHIPNAAIVRWTGIGWSDTYWRTGDISLTDLTVLDGRPVWGTASQFLGNNRLKHTEVTDWYTGTIDGITGENWWYGDGYPGRTTGGYSHSRIGGGIHTQEWGTSTATMHSFALSDGVFNASFQVDANRADNIYPGWIFHGGGGTGHMATSNGDVHLELDNGNTWREHNRFFIPPNAFRLWYRLKVTTADAGDPPDVDRLLVYISNSAGGYDLVDQTWLNNRSTDYSYRIFEIGAYANSVRTLKFEIVKGSGPLNVVNSEVWIDNIQMQLNNQTVVDNVLPSFSYGSTAGKWFSENPLFNIDFFDNVGLNNIYYQVDSRNDSNPANWHNLTSDGTSTLPGSIGSTSASLTIDWHINRADWDALALNGQNNGIHYIYFKVTDDAGNIYITPDQASAFSFGRDVYAPSVFFTAPEENQVVNSTSIDVGWSVSDVVVGLLLSGVDKIHYALDNNQSFTEVAPTVLSHTFSALSDGAHTVYLKATDKAGNESALHELHFSVNTSINPPVAFPLVSPQDAIETTNRKPQFQWNSSSDPDGTGITYEIWYADNEAYQNRVTISGITSTQYTPPADFPDNTTVYWKVKAIDGAGQTRWSTQKLWRFIVNTQNDPPQSFALGEPALGSAIETLTPTLTWFSAIDPDPQDSVAYTVLLGTDPNFSSGTYSEYLGLTENTLAITTPLALGAVYYWRVKATDNHGAITWATELGRYFVTGHLASAITSASPSRNALNVAPGTNILATFASDIDPASLTIHTFVVVGSHSGLHDGTLNYSSTSKTVSFDPVSDFQPGELVSCTITRGTMTINGDSLESAYQWRFMTGVVGGALTLSQDPSIGFLGAACATIGDFDRDGKLDIAVVGDGGLAIIRNLGMGKFATLHTYPSLGGAPRGVTTADFDGDGYMDVAVTLYGTDSVGVFKNDGTGAFSRLSYSTVVHGPWGIMSSDVDNNGSIDLIVCGEADNTLSVMKNDGYGHFSNCLVNGLDHIAHGMVAGDWDGDGDIDLAGTDQWNQRVTILTNSGSGVFSVDTSYAISGGYPDALESGDFDGDGDIDLAACNYGSNTVTIFKNLGTGKFAPSADITVGDNPTGIVASDIDGDGDLDLAVLNRASGTVSILTNNGQGGYNQSTTVPIGNNSWSIAAGRMDDDQDADLVVAGYGSGTVSVIKNGEDAPHIQLVAPVAGMTWPTGTIRVVRWESNGSIPSVNVALSVDSGATYPFILGTVTASRESLMVTVPDTVANRCRIRVQSVSDTSIATETPGAFSIRRINSFEEISFADIQHEIFFSSDIDASDSPSNRIPLGTVVLYRTSLGRFGKFQMLQYGHNIQIRWETFSADGTRYKSGASLEVPGTWSCDLDEGIVEGLNSAVDFFWEQNTATERYVSPQNGAMFAVWLTLPLTSGDLVGYYKLDGNAIDSSPFHLDGIARNTEPIADRFGVPNGALEFNGISIAPETDSGIDLGEVTRFGLQSFSVSLWIKPAPIVNYYGRIFRYGADNNPDSWDGFGVEYNNEGYATGEKPYGILYYGVPYENHTFIPTCRELTLGQWSHIVFSNDRSTNATSFYVNGVLCAQGSGWYQTATGRASIGSNNLTGPNFHGGIDDVRLFNRVLTTAEIRELYHQNGWIGNPVSNDVIVQEGWNIVSVPVRSTDSAVTALFANATSPAYSYGSGYETPGTMSPGKGYWLKYGNLDTSTVVGIPVTLPEVTVSTGWNLIGGFDVDMVASQVTSTPSSILTSSFFSYASGYVASNTLTPGKGYWVKASADGKLQMSGGLAKQDSTVLPIIKDSWIQITVEDNSGANRRLYLAKIGGAKGAYELPPLPPAEILDARFSSGTYVEELNGGAHEIDLSGTAYPLTLGVTGLTDKSLLVRDAATGKILNQRISEGKTVGIRQGISQLIVEVGDNIPTEFSLAQNYPNPFNPTTTIKFALPVPCQVRLTVYNILGQVVREVVNNKYEAGYHSIEFNAERLASGAYFYHLEADKFNSVKKMLILK